VSVQARSRWVLVVLLAVTTAGVAVIARPILHLGLAAYHDQVVDHNQLAGVPRSAESTAKITLDASQLNPTSMQVVDVPSQGTEAFLRQILQTAQSYKRKITVAGTRHTMGGHTLFEQGMSLNMRRLKGMQFDPDRRILTVQAGATWAEVIPYLNQWGYAVAVMQSNNDFSVGGTLSANAHGWQPNTPPIASTVESFRLMTAKGEIVTCSRQDNAELFALVLGGYGLFGIILDVKLRVVPNHLYRAERTIISSQDYITTYRQHVTPGSRVGLAYGRLAVDPNHFLTEAILTTYHQSDPGQQNQPTVLPLPAPPQPGLARTVFVGSVGSDYGKELRWQLEKLLGGEAGSLVSRNQIMNRPSSLFELHQLEMTEILHEYFIPPERFAAFLQDCRQIIPQQPIELLNVTVRNVTPDRDSFLPYARQEVFGLVMLFRQAHQPEAERQMQDLTQKLIAAALRQGGTYYLPYRLHASPIQLEQVYPQIRQFFQRKRHYDPQELFVNQFYAKYSPSFTPQL
jgi:FAD/FMN-containing dehydrogenase